MTILLERSLQLGAHSLPVHGLGRWFLILLDFTAMIIFIPVWPKNEARHILLKEDLSGM